MRLRFRRSNVVRARVMVDRRSGRTRSFAVRPVPAVDPTNRSGSASSDSPVGRGHRRSGRRRRLRRCYHRRPMTRAAIRRDRPRYYLTTSIAYANNKPGLHTLYEVIGADVIARWHRMSGDDTRFLTGTDEHSINIAQSAIDEGRSPRAFVDEKVGFFKDGRGRARDQPRPVHPDDRPRPHSLGPGDGPSGPRQRRHLPRHVRGLVLPERGLPQRDRRGRDRPRHDLPEPSRGARCSG